MNADELRSVMQERQWTIAYLAKTLQVSTSTVERWRAGQSPMSRAVEIAIRCLAHHEEKAP